MDRGYAAFSLFNAIVAAGSSYVCRARDNSVYEVVEQRPLSAARSSALLDSLEAAELRFLHEWGEAWRSSEGTRHDFTFSEADVRPRNVQLHCPPPQPLPSIGAIGLALPATA